MDVRNCALLKPILVMKNNSGLTAVAIVTEAVLEANLTPQVAEAAFTSNAKEAMMEGLTILTTSKIGKVVKTLHQEIAATAEDRRQHHRRAEPISNSHSCSRSSSRSSLEWTLLTTASDSKLMSHLHLFVKDKVTKQQFLVDTGAYMCVCVFIYPHSHLPGRKTRADYKLYALTIPTFIVTV